MAKHNESQTQQTQETVTRGKDPESSSRRIPDKIPTPIQLNLLKIKQWPLLEQCQMIPKSFLSFPKMIVTFY